MIHKPWVVNLIVFFIIAIAATIGVLYFKPTLLDLAENHKHEGHNHDHSGHSHSHSEDEEDDFERGPHHGRLLENGDFQVEVTIYESEGVLPKFRIYFYLDGTPVNPADVNYQMELTRINRTENIPFKQRDNYLESTVEASEPHSFKVKVHAVYKNKPYDWEYESYEGRVELDQESIEANKIAIEQTGPMNLDITLMAMGRIIPNEELTVYISPRFPGIVKAVNKRLGDQVHKGDVLAIIESNESLKDYEIKAEIDGTIIKKNINLGMYLSGQENIFVISDLTSVWADFHIYSQDLSRVDIGDKVKVFCLDGSVNQESTISYISPHGNESTQSVIARAVLDNQGNTWKPGLFITAEITVENVPVNVAVKDGALQVVNDHDVVFIVIDHLFEAAPVQLGRKNKEWVEIKSGLNSGDRYVSENSFIIKADLEKSGAAHEH